MPGTEKGQEGAGESDDWEVNLNLGMVGVAFVQGDLLREE